MVNMQPGGFGGEQWYPQLPEGFEGQMQQGMPGFGTEELQGMPGGGMSGFPFSGGFPGQGMPGFSSGGGFPGQGVPGFSPGGGFPGQGRPGFPSGGGFPGQGRPGFPPGGGFPGQGIPGFPPGGGFPGQGRPGFPGQGPGQQAPTSPPPQYTPAYPEAQLFAVDPGAIAGCLFRFTFVWLSRRQGFWFFPVFVGRNSVAGYRWRNRQRRWEYFGIDLDRIDQFSCR